MTEFKFSDNSPIPQFFLIAGHRVSKKGSNLFKNVMKDPYDQRHSLIV